MIIHQLNRRQSAEFGRFIMGAVRMDARRRLKAARMARPERVPELAAVRALERDLAAVEATFARLAPEG